MTNVAKMLIVDDEPRMTDSVKAMLDGWTCEIETCNCSTEALALLQTAAYDVALLDVRMPGLTGYELLSKLDREEVQTVFLIMTGDASLDSVVEAIRVGASDYLRKPFDSDELLIRVGNAFKQKQLRDERQQIEVEKLSLERQLRQSQKMEAIGTLAGGIAHDFNNILGIVLGNAELAKTVIPSENPALDHLEKILTASNRAKEMVNQLLSFTRKTEAERKPLELNSVVTEALKLLRASIPTNVVIQQRLPEASLVVQGDSTQLHQILINLCTNAAHALEPMGGMLDVNLQSTTIDSAAAANLALEPGEYVRLTVSDTGQGIDPSIIDRIFDPYFTTKGPGKGTGMGLAVVHGIVKNHGGAIDVSSHPNVKTEFRVFLPITVADVARTNTATETSLPSGRERVLLVDDEEMVADMMRQMVAKLGYQVDALTDSRAALEALRVDPERYDLVVTDLTMPHMTGKQLAAEIKLIRSDIPIVLCSGLDDSSDGADARDLGIAEFAMKPLGMQQLATIIRNVLDRRAVERRKSQRFLAGTGAFVISNADPSSRGTLLDISLSGLSFKYYDTGDGFQRLDEITVCTAREDCLVNDLNCKTVSDIASSGDAEPLSVGVRRRGIQFQRLTPRQLDQLRYFIQSNASEVLH